ncbi:MAG TPA: D-sedoheptulose 7-phosphate isomerase [Candidatus Nanoarchaeia archaeon]|nr:D-sedoheptulose 7-phosphate isomerase [Candidatus Nanoarchaeia archaeon]
MKDQIRSMIEESIETKKKVNEFILKDIESAAKLVISTIKSGKKIMLAGNGGSASQASHIAAEFVGRYKIERKGLPSIALTTDTSVITAWSNDYSYDTLFSRQIEALGSKGDVFIAITTSGNSKNLVNAVNAAKKLGIKTIGMLGRDGGKLKGMCDVEVIVPSDNTPRIQETHLMIMHIMCEITDNELFSK